MSTSDRQRFPEGWDPLENGYVDAKPMDDGRWWCLMPLYGGRFRIVIAEDYATAGEHWCYSNPVSAVVSFMDGPEKPPTGWTRHMFPNGRFERRDDQGNPYVSEAD